jgi:hypothetical protein
MKFLPLKVHMILDFIVGIVLILAPWIFQFSDVGGAASWVPIIIGIAAIVMGLSTRGYTTAVVKLFSPGLHMAIDFIAGVILALSPWIFGFNDEGTNAWLPHLIVGIALIGVSLFTNTSTASEAEA